MGRIRTVKPELFYHDELYDTEAESGLPTRLAFIGLFTLADREGRFLWKPRQIKAQLFPYEELDFSAVLEALKAGGFVSHYRVNGKEYGLINSFQAHQQINSKEAQSKLPPPEEGASIQGSHPLSERSEPVTSIHMNSCEFTSPEKETHENSHGERKGREQGKEQGREGVKHLCRADAQPVADEQVNGERISPEKNTEPAILGHNLKPDTTDTIREVFEFWQTTLDHPQAKLDDRRRKLIGTALKTGYAVNDLKTAILGCSLTPHNMGDNDRGQRYDGLHVILRNADQIDRFIHNAMNQESMDANRQHYQRGCSGEDEQVLLSGTNDELWNRS